MRTKPSSSTLVLPPNVVDGMQPYRDCCWAGGDKEKNQAKDLCRSNQSIRLDKKIVFGSAQNHIIAEEEEPISPNLDQQK